MKRIAQQCILLSGIVTLAISGTFAQVAVSPAAKNINRSSSTTVVNVDNVTTAYGYGFETHNINEKDLKSKEVSKELEAPKNGEIYIENTNRNIQIKTWSQPKVKVTTLAYFEKESSLTDTEWLDKLGITLKVLGSSIKIKSASSWFNRFGVGTPEPMIVSGYPGQVVTTNILSHNGGSNSSRPSVNTSITIYVPAGSKLDIETKYSELQLPANIGDVFLDITNGSFEAENLNKLRLRSKYSNANLRDIKEAEIEFANGRFTANNIEDLDIESKYSTIEMASAKKIKMVSTNDEFEVEDVSDVSGRKNYGNLRITRLAGSIDMDGSNADVKIRNIGANVKLIKINNRYADIRIPLRDMKNYTVDFMGSYSTVYGDFERKEVEPTEEEKKEYARLIQSMINTSGTAKISSGNGKPAINIPAQSGKATTPSGTIEARTVPMGTTGTISARTLPMQETVGTTGTISGGTFSGTLSPTVVQGYPAFRGVNSTPAKFTASIGNGSGLKVQMKCQNCTVDFK